MAIMSYETIAIKYRINKKSQNGITLGQTILNNTDCVVVCLVNLAFVGFCLLPLAIENARLIGANLTASEKVSKMYDTLSFSPYSFGSIFEDWKRRILSPKPLIASRVPWLLYLKSTRPEKYEKEIQKYDLLQYISAEVVPTLYRFNVPEVPLARFCADLAVQTSRLQDTPPNIADLSESSAFNVTKVLSRYLKNSSPRVGNTLYFENESGNIPSQTSQIEIKEIVLDNVKDLQSVAKNLEIVKVSEKERKKIRKLKSKETRTPRVNELPTKKEKTTFLI